jgi:membrane fusion protein (multidrug efflux system)
MAIQDITAAPAGGGVVEFRRVEAPSPVSQPTAKAPSIAPDLPSMDLQAQIATVTRQRRRRPSLRAILMLGGIFVVVVGSSVAWLHGGRYASTDDAYIQAGKLLVTPDVSGLVSSVNVHEGQAVKAGDLLFQLDPLPFRIALDSANANLRQTALTIGSMKADYKVMLSNVAAQEAQVALDQVTNDRYAALVKDNNVSRALYDQARFTLQLDKSKLISLQQQAEVQLAKLDGKPDLPVTEHPLYRQAKAQVDEVQRQLDHTSVRAPFSGTATQVDALQPGTYVVSQTAALTGTGAIALVSTDQTWVTAQMKETDLTYVKPGNHVDVSVDTYPGQVWSGTVQAISPASGSEFSVLPAQNSSGNWVKVVQRIPVQIAIERPPGSPALRSGMSVYVDVDTGHRRSLADLF